MKFILKELSLGLVAVSLSVASLASEYRRDLMEIVGEFDTSNPEARYEARLRLLQLVSEATAPDQAMGASKITDDLLHCLNQKDTPRLAKMSILRQLARVGTAQAVPELSRIFLGKDLLLSENARKALETMGSAQASEALRNAYAKASAQGKKDLIRSFGRRRDAAALELIEKALSQSDADAAWALGQIGGERAAAVLTTAYPKASKGELQQAIERSLLSLEATDGATLLSIFQEGSDGATRRAALRELVNRQDPAAANALKTALRSPNEDMRVVAVQTALFSGVKSYREQVVARSEEMQPRELGALLVGLKQVERRTAELIAIRAFGSGDEVIQALALDALASCGSDRAVDVLFGAFSGGNKTLSSKAASAMAQLQSGELDHRLARMLRSNSKSEILLAVEVLAYRSIPGGKSILLRLVGRTDGEIAKAAMRTLSTTADESDLKALLTIAERQDGETRRLIVALLKKLAPAIGSESLQTQVNEL